jgi:hypothetical protein
MLFGVVGALVVGVVLLAFLWPTTTSEAHNLPVSIVGQSAAVKAVEDALAEGSPDLVTFVEASDRAEAVAQIEARETTGAIILSDVPEVLTAPASSAVSAQILSGVAAQLQAQLTQRVAASGGDVSAALVTVTPVVALSEDDANGSGLIAAAFPIVLGGILGGILMSLLVVGVIRRLAGLAAFGIAAGVIFAAVMQGWMGILQGSFLLNALAMGLAVVATSAFIVGCTSLIGPPGIAVGAVLTMFIGNPLSAAAAPWQFIAEPFGAIGQFLVPGAANSLVRSLSYFPNADMTQQWLTLAGWAVLGVALALVGHFRSTAAMRVPAATLENEHVPAHSATTGSAAA